MYVDSALKLLYSSLFLTMSTTMTTTTALATSRMHSSALLVLILLITVPLVTSDTRPEQQRSKNDSKTCGTTIYTVPPDCSVVMAPSQLEEDAGYGIYSLQDRPRGAPILFGDVVIPLPDVLTAKSMEFFSQHYWFSSDDTGGRDEGKNAVHSIAPGVGMLVNASPLKERSNVLPHRPSQDDGDCPRESCAMAGSFSHYSNYTWFSKGVQAGDELLMHRQDQVWWDERGLYDEYEEGNEAVSKASLPWLRENGMCVDNLMPKQPSSSAGRGAFTTRFLPKDTLVAPVPVVPIFDWKTSLNLIKTKKTKKKKQVIEQQWQLLLNYCLGHNNSSVLLFPYSPIVNLINHDRDKVNVKLQWSSTRMKHPEWLNLDVDDLEDEVDETGGLLMELVALRDIAPGEEIYLDYGSDWQTAFDSHIWPAPSDSSSPYTPAHVMDEVATKVRTDQEQVEFPYASNLGISCFYDFQGDSSSVPTGSSGGVTTIPWNFTRRVFDWSNLRPCSIMQRHESAGGSHAYTVRIRNRAPASVVPKMHVVSKVPRQAIRFYNQPYTTDTHLPYAFRHWIGLDEGVFPEAWLDENNEGGDDDDE
jgi:hypothetical protein